MPARHLCSGSVLTSDTFEQEVFAKTTERLVSVATSSEYPQLCEQLLVQGLVSLIEEKVR